MNVVITCFFSDVDRHITFTAQIFLASGYQYATEHGILFGPINHHHFQFRDVVPIINVVFIEHGEDKRSRGEISHSMSGHHSCNNDRISIINDELSPLIRYLYRKLYGY